MVVEKGYKHTDIGIIPEDWNELRLNEVVNLMTNGFVGTAKTHYTELSNGILYIQGYNVMENSFNFHGIKYVTLEFHNKNQKSCLREGDLLTVQTGDVGLTTIVPRELEGSNCHALIISRFKKSHVYSKFVSFYFNSNQGRSRLKLIETGTTMKHLNVGDMLQFKIPLPPLPEQTAIANALSDMDALIAQTEKLIEKKKAIKQGVMQELLKPKEGWVTKKLGEVCEIKKGQLITDSTRVNGDIPVIAGGKTPAYYHNKSNRSGKTITISGSGASAGYVSFHDYPIFASDCSTISNSSKYNVEFIFYWLQLNQSLIFSLQTGGAQPHIHPSDLNPLDLSLPPIEDQDRIAIIFRDLQTDINILETKHQKLKHQKQGMMQALLTGKIRLI